MAKQTPKYGLIFSMFVVAAALTHGARLMPNQARFTADFSTVPLNIGQWEGQDSEISEEVRKGIEADKVLSRVYTRPDSDYYMGLLVVYRKYGRRGFVHRPEMCYPAAGWEIVKNGLTEVPYMGRKAPAVKIIAERDYEREMVVYWFASGDRLEANYIRQQFRMALDRLVPEKYGWAFIRINCPIISTEDEALKEIRKFVRQVSYPLTKALTDSNLQHTKP